MGHLGEHAVGRDAHGAGDARLLPHPPPQRLPHLSTCNHGVAISGHRQHSPHV